MSIRQILLVLGALLLSVQPGFAAEPDWSNYAALLRDHVKQGSKHGTDLAVVDYRALEKSGALEAVYRQLSEFPVQRLAGREEKLAFYINAYNILALKMVLDHWPLESIKDAGSLLSPVWDKPAGEIGGKPVTLGQIEHKILRPMGEPRVHFAIVCASVSCPDLSSRPYTAARLDAQLDEQVRRFLGNKTKGVAVTDQEIRVSRIFDWFEEDFQRAGGVDAFVRRYRPNLPALPVEADMPYDWDLNEGGDVAAVLFPAGSRSLTKAG
jgi:Protein of unknown function, DUF547